MTTACLIMMLAALTPEDRSIVIRDPMQPTDVFVGPQGSTTVIAFPEGTVVEDALLADPLQRFAAPTVTGSMVVLAATTNSLPTGAAGIFLTIRTRGGAVTFSLRGATKVWDRHLKVRVERDDMVAATPSGAGVSCAASLAEVQARYDECLSGESAAATMRIARMLGAKSKNPQWGAERRPFSTYEKQSRLLVAGRGVFRLVDQWYFVVEVTNRDPSRSWTFDRAEMAAVAGKTAADVRVVGATIDTPSLPPNATGTIVVAGSLGAAPEASTRFTLRIFERSGTRHITVEDIQL